MIRVSLVWCFTQQGVFNSAVRMDSERWRIKMDYFGHLPVRCAVLSTITIFSSVSTSDLSWCCRWLEYIFKKLNWKWMGLGLLLMLMLHFYELKLLPLKSGVGLVISWTVTVDLEATAVSGKEGRNSLLHFSFIDTECYWYRWSKRFTVAE